MKALILSRDDNRAANQTIPPRFSEMIRVLKRGGMDASYCRVGTAEELAACLQQERPSLVFSAAHYTKDQKNVHAILEGAGLPYIGSPPEVIELALSKAALKDHWRARGIPTPDYRVVRRSLGGTAQGLEDELEDYPYLVKPSKEGNSRGLQEDSIVFDKAELERLIARLLTKYDELLVEQYLGRYPDLREFTAAMIGNGESALVMPVEIVLQTQRRWRIVTTTDKDEHHTSAVPITDDELSRKVEAQARQALSAAGVCDYARCDMLMAEGKLYAIEINGQPMVPDRWFAACARTRNMDDDQYINAIFLAGMARLDWDDIPAEMQSLLPERIYRQLCEEPLARHEPFSQKEPQV